MKITILVGLPGSGKTTLGDQLVKENGTFLDDFSTNYGLEYLVELVEKKTENIVVSDVYLCREISRKNFGLWLEINAPGYKLEWVFFENDPEKCGANVRYRMAKGDTRKVLGLLSQLSRIYKVPSGCKVITIYKTEG